MELDQVHHGIKFEQAPFMKSYVEFNSFRREKPINELDISFTNFLSAASMVRQYSSLITEAKLGYVIIDFINYFCS